MTGPTSTAPSGAMITPTSAAMPLDSPRARSPIGPTTSTAARATVPKVTPGPSRTATLSVMATMPELLLAVVSDTATPTVKDGPATTPGAMATSTTATATVASMVVTSKLVNLWIVTLIEL
uniref:Uncharacterized protein n=1 Tax=Panagrellus redivivus TaxID=6233 RepID=A0A7E4VLW9_PANRE